MDKVTMKKAMIHSVRRAGQKRVNPRCSNSGQSGYSGQGVQALLAVSKKKQAGTNPQHKTMRLIQAKGVRLYLCAVLKVALSNWADE